jgi:hypothetical protein
MLAAQLSKRQRTAVGLGSCPHHLRHERAWLQTKATSPIADASRAWTEIGIVVTAHTDDVAARDQKDNTRQTSGAPPATKTKVWRG